MHVPVRVFVGFLFFFFFQAEDGIRDYKVTGVQTCALPISRHPPARFGGGLVRLPPDTANVPTEVAKDESRFGEQLLEAHGDPLAKSLSMDELKDHPNLKKHFDRQRKHFYLAELLRNFTRDNIPEIGRASCRERV